MSEVAEKIKRNAEQIQEIALTSLKQDAAISQVRKQLKVVRHFQNC